MISTLITTNRRLRTRWDPHSKGTPRAVSWKRILIGAGIGFAAGFGILGTWKLPANAENRVSFRRSRQRLVRRIP